MFNNSFSGKRDYKCHNVGVLVKSVLTDLRAGNFVHACHRVRNLPSTGY